MREVVAKYEKSALAGDELQVAIDLALAEVLADPEAAEELEQIGINASMDESPSITAEERGVAPLIVAIVVAVGVDITKEGAKKLWRLVEKKLKNRKGRDVLTKEQLDDS